MELSNTRIVPAPPAAVWDALNDPAVLQACIPGCESFARTGDNAYALVMSARIGPVAARFNGKMTMSDIDAPNGYTLNFEGQGGAAGFARGEARVSLAREGEQHTALTYVAKAQVGGKLAQVGSRLIDGVAQKLTEEFFTQFVAVLSPPAEVATARALPAATGENPPARRVVFYTAVAAAIVTALAVAYVRYR